MGTLIYKTTLGEILDRGNWGEYCSEHGLDVYCINTGLADSKEEVEMTLSEAKKLGMIDD